MSFSGVGVGIEIESVGGSIVIVIEFSILSWLSYIDIGVCLRIVRIDVGVIESAIVRLISLSDWVVGVIRTDEWRRRCNSVVIIGSAVIEIEFTWV
jgi:hypothetical protein